MQHVVKVDRLTHTYPAPRRQRSREQPTRVAHQGETEQSDFRSALKNVSFEIRQGEIFCLLGPNGSGKSTLFRILSTMLRQTAGSASIFDLNLPQRADDVRKIIGVVFQHPSLDKKLTARENLLHQGHLYNLRRTTLNTRIIEALSMVGMLDRSDEMVEHLSGGLQRRVELAKAILHRPRLLILDEPSTGLDPGARRDFIQYLRQLSQSDGVTSILTTHILDEAEKSDRLAILDRGSLVALGTPQELKNEIGGDVISVTTKDPEALSQGIRKYFNALPQIVDSVIRIERNNGHEFIPELVQAFPGQIEAVTLSKPTLEDVFIHKTGHRFWETNDIH